MHRRARPRRGPRVRRVRPLSLGRPERRQPQVPRAPRLRRSRRCWRERPWGCIGIRRCRRDRRFPLVPKRSSGRSRCLVPRLPAVPSFRRCVRRPRMASHRLLLIQPARDGRAVRSGPRSSVSSVRCRRGSLVPAGLPCVPRERRVPRVARLHRVRREHRVGGRGQRPALGGPSRGGGGRPIRSRQPVRKVFLGSVPRGELSYPPPRRGTSRVAPPGLPRVPRERRVPRAARLRRVRREDTAQVASSPASGLGWADYRAGSAAHTLKAVRAYGLPGSVPQG